MIIKIEIGHSLDRLVVALETVVHRLADPNHVLIARNASMEGLLRDFIAVMENPHSTDSEWATLLDETKHALGDVEAGS